MKYRIFHKADDCWETDLFVGQDGRIYDCGDMEPEEMPDQEQYLVIIDDARGVGFDSLIDSKGRELHKLLRDSFAGLEMALWDKYQILLQQINNDIRRMVDQAIKESK